MTSQDLVLARNEVFSAMESDTPYASYIKTILGQVAVTVWDSTLDKPTEIILNGNPKKKEEGCIVKTWNVKEDSVFKRLNIRHFKSGTIIPYQVPANSTPERTIEQSTDDELKEILNSKYLSLINKLNKIDSVAVLFRMRGLAEDMEKSSKIIDAIEKRISEVQLASYEKPKAEQVEEEE